MAGRPVAKPSASSTAAASVAPGALDPAALYVVDLRHVVRVGRTSVLPGRGVRLRGDILADLLANDPAAVGGHSQIAA